MAGVLPFILSGGKKGIFRKQTFAGSKCGDSRRVVLVSGCFAIVNKSRGA